MTFLEYIHFLMEKYQVKQNEILYEMNKADISITKGNLSRKLNGERTFTSNEFLILLKTLNLSIAEEEKATELFKRYQFGETEFQEVSLMRDYFEQLFDDTRLSLPETVADLDSVSDISDEKALADVMFSIIEEIWTKDAVRIFCQPDYRQMIDTLTYYQRKVPFEIQHLICLNNESKADNNSYNIHCLMSVDKLAFANVQYHIRYFYDRVNARANFFSVFPYFIVTSQRLLLISANYKSGYLITDKMLVQRFLQDFDKMYAGAAELFEPIENDFEYLKACMRMEQKAKEKYYMIQQNMCLLFGTNETILRSCGKWEVPYSENIIQMQCSRASQIKAKCYVMHTNDNVSDFLKTGVSTDMPSDICNPIPTIMRAEVVANARQNLMHQNILINKDFFHIPSESLIACYDDGSVMISHKPQGSNTLRLITTERTLFKSVWNFCEYLLRFEAK